MADYISREAALTDFERCNLENPNWTPQRVKQLLVRQPAAAVVDVVRCEDCAWNNAKKGKVSCRRYAALIESDPDDYCSFGKRRENDGGRNEH